MLFVRRALLPAAALLLSACAQQTPNTLTLDNHARSCQPMQLSQGQEFNLRLPSNPTTGFRWSLRSDGAPQLKLLGPEVYTVPEKAGVVGGAGVSTWRFRAASSGDTTLALEYARPWEQDVAPAQRFDCRIRVK
ncbi:peptidase inhibitor I42 [Stutzerimonas decontaminans]|uniref:Peptidase inhibitor I42 n=2 Tax=Stutzerimonas TaxID=2901164 RepID=A0ABX4VZH3_9GAMM|nr:protease inhibitor I42 family protein [Stutzerimonas decontaminans]AHY43883.1 peptidase inhibitor I42 [Stutzerimonas decontaminans]MCQ4243649.1 protease inhibitor I42 family protein [Stutzerimonas decontaminans]PNF84656.1 peptidase inhibitor I42 [Stutzerimonas decontaminans]